MLMVATVVYFAFIGVNRLVKQRWGVGFFDYSAYNFPATAFFSFSVFVFCLKLPLTEESCFFRTTKWVGPSVFSVYLQHDSLAYRKIFWPLLAENYDSPWYICKYAIKVIMIFVVCVAVDKVFRQILALFIKTTFKSK